MSDQQIIIFEGHDGTGKSQIAEEISKRQEIPVFKNEQEFDRWWDPEISTRYSARHLVSFLEQTGHSVILDRHYPSEYVYGKMFGRAISEVLIWELDHRMAKMDATIVECRKKPENYEEDSHGIVEDTEMYDELKFWYGKFKSNTECEYIEFMTDSEKLQQQVATIEDYIGLGDGL